jgi:hypothetical protein
MHGLESLAPARRSYVSVDCKSKDPAVVPDTKWSHFFQKSGGAFMRVLDDVLEKFVANKRYTRGGEFSTLVNKLNG